MVTTIGLIGAGLMGQGIAHNLVSKGFDLVIMNHPGNQPLDELLQAGAKTADSPRAVAQQSQVVLLVVTGAPQVQAVVSGDQGLLQGLQPGTVVIDCTTSLPDTTERMAQKIQALGAHYLDAPMTRLAKEAREGRLNLLVGGDEQVLAQVHHILAAFSENITHVGPVGHGHRMKLLHNFVSVGTMTLIAEAAAHAAQTGIDLQVLERVLSTGGGAGIALQRLTPALLENRTDSVPFFLGNAFKDLDYYLNMARTSGVHDTVAQGVTQTLKDLVDQGHAQDYLPALVKLLQ